MYPYTKNHDVAVLLDSLLTLPKPHSIEQLDALVEQAAPAFQELAKILVVLPPEGYEHALLHVEDALRDPGSAFSYPPQRRLWGSTDKFETWIECKQAITNAIAHQPQCTQQMRATAIDVLSGRHYYNDVLKFIKKAEPASRAPRNEEIDPVALANAYLLSPEIVARLAARREDKQANRAAPGKAPTGPAP